MPKLWWRDVILLGGHALTIVLIMIARWSGAGPADLAANPYWWVITSAPPIFAIATYVYYELFVIGRQ